MAIDPIDGERPCLLLCTDLRGFSMDSATRTELDAAVLRRLLKHLNEHKDVQNIELMILAKFCRNCLSKWYVAAAAERGIEVDIEEARERIYGMTYAQWKRDHQPPATEDQLRRFNAVSEG